jgi:hypothetical protein
VAIVVALLSMLLMSALGVALVQSTTLETLIARNFRSSIEGQYAAEAVLERAMDDLAATLDWSSVLAGLTRSGFTDGPPSGVRTLADGSRLDLDRTRNMLNCRKATACSASELVAATAERPWGMNNPDWQLFAYGPLAGLLPGVSVASTQYVVVLAADDPSENDSDPLRDGIDTSNPGAGVIRLRAEAFGPRGGHQVVELTVERSGVAQPGVRVVAWRPLR